MQGFKKGLICPINSPKNKCPSCDHYAAYITFYDISTGKLETVMVDTFRSNLFCHLQIIYCVSLHNLVIVWISFTLMALISRSCLECLHQESQVCGQAIFNWALD